MEMANKYEGVNVVILDKNFGGPARPRNIGIKKQLERIVAVTPTMFGTETS